MMCSGMEILLLPPPVLLLWNRGIANSAKSSPRLSFPHLMPLLEMPGDHHTQVGKCP